MMVSRFFHCSSLRTPRKRTLTQKPAKSPTTPDTPHRAAYVRCVGRD